MEPPAGEVDTVYVAEKDLEKDESWNVEAVICDQEMFRSNSVFIVFVSLLLFLE